MKVRILPILLVFLSLAGLPGLISMSGAVEKNNPSTTALAAGSKPVINRLASYQFLQGERPLRSPLAMVRDPHNGDLIVSSFESGEVVILDRNGALLKRLGKQSGLVTPYGVAIDKEGRIYVSELQTGLLKILSPSGLLMDKIDLSALRHQTVSPGRITLGQDGEVFIVDLSGNEILLLTDQGTRLSPLGSFDYLQKAGQGPGKEIIGISGMGAAVTIFNANGQELRSFGKHGDSSARNVSFPTGFTVDSKNRLWIADAFQHRLKVFSLAGEFLFNFGRMEEETGGFFFPVDLCFGDNGELYVLEKGANRIQVFQVEDLNEETK